MRKRKRMAKRLLASVLCAAMVITALPMNTFAEEYSEESEDVIVATELDDDSYDSNEGGSNEDEGGSSVIDENTDLSTAESEEIDYRTDETTTETEKSTEDITAETREETEIETEEETETETETEKATVIDEKKKLHKDAMYSGDGLWVYELVDGYATILGYTDTTVSNLDVPYTVDGYYVNAIGEEAFVENENLDQMYINGNVTSIASDAFEGLDVTLSGYNGTYVLSYAKSNGISYKNITNVDYFTFTDKVIDYSYVQKGRYYIKSETQIRLGAPEAAQLKVGSIFYIPEVIGDLYEIYEVTSLSDNGNWVDVTFTIADSEEALERIVVEEQELTPDWSKAEWIDGVEVYEEKLGISSTGEGSINLKYEKALGEKKSFNGVTYGKTPFSFFVEGKFSVKGTAKIDINILKGQVNTCSFTIEPTVTIKGGLKVEGKNTDKNEKTIVEMVTPQDYEFYLGKVPLISAAKVISVDAAVYVKVSASGEITLSVKGSGKLGTQYNKSTKKWDAINTWSWGTPTISSSAKLTIGPAQAIELNCAVLGKVLSLEFFEGAVVDFTAVTNLGTSGTVDASTGSSSTQSVGDTCFNVKVDGKYSLTLELKLELLKKGSVSSNNKWSWELISVSKEIFKKHYETGKGFMDKCSYSNFTVEFNTDCPTELEPLSVMGGNKIEKPAISFVGHTLDGWYTDKKFTNKWNFKTDTVTEDITLYAKWIGTTKTVTFDTNHSDYDKKNFTEEVEVGRTISKPSDLMWIDHKFEGWYKDEKLTEKWDFSKDTMPNSDLTLYAKWTDSPGYDPYAANNVSSGEKTFNGHSYTHIATYMSFSEAKAYAEARGGYLATINSAEEQAFLASYLYNDCAQQYLWLGMTSVYNWEYWLTGESVSGYTNWSTTPATTSSQYNAALIRSSGKWTTLSNTSTAHFVIEWGPYVSDPSVGLTQNKDDVQYTYDENTKTAQVTGWNNSTTNITISSSYNGYPVTAIADSAFRNNTILESITIPSSVVSIGSSAFYGCTSLKSISIPNSVTSIGSYAFYNTTALEKVTWSSKVYTISDYTFYGCKSLKKISCIANVTSIGANAFYGCNVLSGFTYPTNLKTIGASAFYNCYGLTNGNIPDSVTTIGASAFYNCYGLTNITVSSGMAAIQSNTFYNCSGAASIVIPRTVSSIASGAFGNVNGTYKVYLGSYAEKWCMDNSKTYVNISSSTSRVTFNVGLNNLGNSLSNKDSNLVDDVYVEAGKRITEPELSVEGYTLAGWYTDPEYTNKWDFAKDTVSGENITLYAKWIQDESSFDYTVANGQATITGYNGDNSIVVIPETLGGYTTTAIAENAFNSEVITSVQIPACVVEIAGGAFGAAKNLYEIIIPESNEFKIVDGVLYSYSMKRLICAPQARTYITYSVPDGTTTIDKRAFANHLELSSISIPDSVTVIASDAFEGNHNLTIYGNIESCTAKTFADSYAYDYNIYQVNYYNGSELLYSANIQAGELIEDYYAPTGDFMKFGGWYKDGALTDKWDFEKDTMPAEDIKLYMKWDSEFAVEMSDSTVTITGYSGSAANVVIPETINSYSVTAIASGAFNDGISKVTIPSCVIDIAENAIPKSVTIVGDAESAAQVYAESTGNTFEIRKYTVTFDSLGGSEVASISATPGSTLELPSPVRTNYYFAGWYQNTGYSVEWTSENLMPTNNITLYALWRIANNNITDNFGYNLLEDGTIEITYYSGTKTSLSIPDVLNGYTVSRIGNFAFKDNTTLLTVTVPDTIKTIGEYAFADSAIRILKGCENVEIIDSYAFADCTSLRTVAFSSNLKTINTGAFFGCENLFEISLPEGLTTIGSKAFYGCKELEKVTFPSTIEVIGSQAFQNTDISEVDVPSILKNQMVGIFDDGVKINYIAGNELRILSIKQSTKSKVTITWNEIDGAAKYAIYRMKKGESEYTRIKSTTSTESYGAGLTEGNTYYFKVEALDSKGEVIVTSNEAEITMTGFDLPSVVSIEAESTTSAVMTVKKISGAEGYEIYRADSYDGNYTFLKTITSTTTTNTGLIGGGDYYYKIRVYKTVNDEKDYSDWSEVYYFHMPYKYMTAPENVTAYQSSSSSIEISWDAVDGADGYTIYRNTNGEGYKKLKSVTETTTQNYKLTSGSTYAYKVQAYYVENGETITGSLSKEVKVSILDLATPVITSIVQKTESSAAITWSGVSDADGYKLYRSTDINGSYSAVKTVTSTSASNYNLVSGTTYYYKVRAYKNDDNGKQTYSGYSPVYSITMSSLAKAVITGLVQTSANTAKLSWNALSGATGYEIWASVNGTSEYELVQDQTECTTTVSGLYDGTAYYYKVRGYVINNGVKGYGDYSEPMSIECIGSPTISVIEQSSASAVELIWTKVSKASGYELWRSSDGGKEYTRIKTITGNTTNNFNLTAGTTYSYKIRAYRTNEKGAKVYGFFSEPASAKIIKTPSISTISQADGNTVTLKWNKVSGVEGYVLYRSEVSDGIYSQVQTVTSNTVQDTELEASKTYYYKLAAYVTVNGVKQYSMSSDVMYITLLEVPRIIEVEELSTSTAKITWTPVENATGYKLYRAESEEGTYKCIKTVKDDTSSINYKLTVDKMYYYKVIPYIVENSTTHMGVESSSVGIYMTNLAAPVISDRIQSTSTSITLKWDNVEGANGYEVYRSDSRDGTYVKVGDVTSTTFYDTSRYVGTIYYYKVRGYKTTQSGNTCGPFSDISGVQMLDATTITRIEQENTTSVTIAWNSVRYATAYNLYRSKSDNEVYEYIGTTTDTKISDINLEEGGTYYYKIQTVIDNENVSNLGPQSSVAGITISNQKNVVFKTIAQNGDRAVNLEWDTVLGAEKYEIIKANEENGEYTIVNTVSSTSYTVSSGLTSGETYWFAVRPYKSAGGLKIYVGYSEIFKISLLKATELGYLYKTSDTSAILTWKQVDKAEGYEVARSENGAEYITVYTTDDVVYDDITLTEDATYSYKVRPYVTVNGAKSYGNYSSVLTLKASSDSGTIGNVKWTLNGNELTFSGEGEIGTTFKGNNSIAKVIIEDGITGIAANAFQNCTKLIEVTIGEGVTSIGSYAFYGCSKLKDVTMGDNVSKIGAYAFANTGLEGITLSSNLKTIDDHAFYNDTLLNNVDIPDGVTTLGNYIFCNCTNLVKISVPGTVTSVSEYTFSGIGATTAGPIGGGYDYEYGWTKTIPNYAFSRMSKLETINLSSTLTSIGNYAFYNDTSLNNITIPSSVESIGNNAFYQCNSLKAVLMEDGVETIGQYAFGYCNALEKITLSSNLTSIGNYAFYSDTSLDNVYVPEEVTYIGDYAFYNCSSLIKISVPGTVTTIYEHTFNGIASVTAGPVGGGYDYEYGWTRTIPNYAFNRMTKLESVSFPSTLKFIGNNVFYEDASLNNVTIPNGVREIGNYAFYNCSSLIKISVPGTVTTIYEHTFNGIASVTAGPAGVDYDYEYGWTRSMPSYAFSHMAKLTTAIISGVEEVGTYAFYGDTSLEGITIDGDVEEIGSYVFYGCTNLKEATLGAATVGNCSFQNCTNLETVTMSDSVITVKEYAFQNCTGLKTVTIGDGVISIGNNAFYGCKELKTVTMGDGVETIGQYAFYNCSSLENITLSNNLISIGNNVFANDTALNNVIIPDGVTSIGSNAFYGCSSLKKLRVPGTVSSVSNGAFYGIGSTTAGPIGSGCDYEYGWTKTIPSYAFANITGLTEVSFPNTLKTIGIYAFYNDTSLNNVIIPSGVREIGNYAFNNCSGLTSISVPETVTSVSEYTFSGIGSTTAGPIGSGCDYEYGWTKTIPSYAFSRMAKLEEVDLAGVKAISNYAFYYATALNSIIVDDDTNSIGNYAFSNCTNLMEATIGAKKIGSYAFQNCTKLDTVTIRDSVESLMDYVFQNCSGIREVTIGDGLTSIGNYIFQNCTKLNTVSMGNNIETIGQYAFAGCKNLEGIELPTSLVSIGNYAFYNDTLLNNIAIPNGVTYIGNYAFSGCSSLTKLSVPSTVTSISEYTFNGIGATTAGPAGGGYDYEYGWTKTIPNYAFSRMTKLTAISLPNTLKTIGNYAFYLDTSLNNVVIPNSVKTLGSYTFYGNTSLDKITLGSSVRTIGSYTFYGCTILEEITLLDGVGSISDYAFANCTVLNKVTIPDNVKSISNNAFNNSSKVVIYCNTGSYAETYASSKGITYVAQ